MKKEIEIKVPTNWSAVTLGQYLDINKDLEIYGEEENGKTAVLLHHLCNVEPSLISKLPSDILFKIKEDLAGFMGQTEFDLQRIININGVEYGFEPNLSKMEYGAYLDITRHETINIDKNWKKIMAILYRPITSKRGKFYDIKGYNPDTLNEDQFENVSMDVHFGAYFFFLHTLTDLVNDILNSLKKETELPQDIRSILARNGEVIKRLYNYQEMISPNSILSLRNP